MNFSKIKTTCYPKSLKQPWRQNLQHTLTTKVIKSSVGRHAFQQRPWRSPLWPCCCRYFAFWTVSCRHAVIIDKICSKLHLPAKVTAIFPSSRSWWHWDRWREECCSSLAPLHGLATDSRSPELWRVAGERGLCPHSSALSITCVRIGKKNYWYVSFFIWTIQSLILSLYNSMISSSCFKRKFVSFFVS